MTIVDKFCGTVALYPNKAALKSEAEGSLTYCELDKYSNYIARRVLSEYSGGDGIVGICLDRSFMMIASMLGVLKAGKSYLPLDPNYPSERLQLMLSKSSVKFIICADDTAHLFGDSYAKLLIRNREYINEPPTISIDPHSLAYIQYTSGSTGSPNGVMVTHHSILNTLVWRINYYGLNQFDSNLQIPSFSFASSVEDIFCTLLSGGTLILIKSKDLLNTRLIRHLVEKHAVTHLLMVPSLFKEVLKELGGIESLRFVVVAGEKLQHKLVDEHYVALPQTVLYNEYGMTETSVACMVCRIGKGDESIFIGNTIDNMDSLIYDPDEDGIGELYISGHGLSIGYHNDAEATQYRFVFIDAVRYFKTGDFVKLSADGNLQFIGRRDNQMKINGQRVDFSEIDYVLQQDGLVSESITCCIDYRNKESIVSFIKTSSNNYDYFSDLLKKRLPKYYVPDYIKLKKEFTYLPNKKIDVKGMKDLFVNKLEEVAMTSDPMFEKICKVLRDVASKELQLENNTDIQKSGIDSIEYIQFLAGIEEVFDFEFGYDYMEKLGTVSIVSLYDYLKSLGK